MEKPKWAFENITYLNNIKNNEGKNFFIFSDFEHNWDLFQFLNNENEYYFNLNKNINSEHNFKIIYSTYLQKCKHLDINNIHFILLNEEQELFLKKTELNIDYIFKDKFVSHFNNKNMIVDESLTNFFTTYTLNDAIRILNDKNKFEFDNTLLKNSIEKNVNKRIMINKKINNICFFGASVTQQISGYVDQLTNNININNIKIIKKGYSGCHIKEAMWLVNDVIALNPDICFMEWTTSVFKCDHEKMLEYLYIIVNKLIQNNIIPVFLYLYKNDIQDYINIIDTYEKIADYYNISSFHQYKVIQELKINSSLLLKDNCHTIFQGSQFYANILVNFLNDFLLNPNLECKQNNNLLDITKFQMSKYNNIKIIDLNNIIDVSNLEFEIFNNKKYFKITSELTTRFFNNHNIIAINILYYKNNGFIIINDKKIQSWNENCYYKRFGYLNLDMKIINEFKINISQEIFDTPCKYFTNFPNEKFLYISEIIYI